MTKTMHSGGKIRQGVIEYVNTISNVEIDTSQQFCSSKKLHKEKSFLDKYLFCTRNSIVYCAI